MARPRLGKEKSERFQLVITAEELEAIEDWRFRNRVQTKSEAIRRLCQIGKDMEAVIPNATDHADDLQSSIRLLFEFADTSARAQDDGGKIDTDELINRVADLLNRAEDLFLILMRENNRIIPLAERKGIKKALAEAAASEEEVTRFIDTYLAGGQEHEEARIMRQVLDEMSPDERARYRKMDAGQRSSFFKMKTGLKRIELVLAQERKERGE